MNHSTICGIHFACKDLSITDDHLPRECMQHYYCVPDDLDHSICWYCGYGYCDGNQHNTCEWCGWPLCKNDTVHAEGVCDHYYCEGCNAYLYMSESHLADCGKHLTCVSGYDSNKHVMRSCNRHYLCDGTDDLNHDNLECPDPSIT